MSELQRAAAALRDHPPAPATALEVIEARASHRRRHRHRRLLGVAMACALVALVAVGLSVHRSERTEPVMTGPGPTARTTTSRGRPGSSTPLTTPTTAHGPEPSDLPTASLPGPAQTLHHVTPPAVQVPATPCTNADLQASVQSLGPYQGMTREADIVTLTSSRPCYVEGYPALRFQGDASVSVIDGGVTWVYVAPQARVAVGEPRAPASFYVQLGTGAQGCPTSSELWVGLPGAAPTVAVSLAAVQADQTGFVACPQINVSPFEQGNTDDNYAFP